MFSPCLKIPKGYSKAVNRERTEKKQWPKDKRTNNDLQNITQKSPPKTISLLSNKILKYN
jgi:hypothetical protein